MCLAAGVDVPPNDVPARIDPACLSIDRSWEVDSGVHALAQEEAVAAAGRVAKISHNLFQRIDVPGLGEIAAGDIEGLKTTVHYAIGMCKSCSQVVVQARYDISVRRCAVVHRGLDVKHLVVASGIAYESAHICPEIIVVTTAVNIAARRDPLGDRAQVPGT